jgi:hypothetical protein
LLNFIREIGFAFLEKGFLSGGGHMYTKQLKLEQVTKIQYAEMVCFWRHDPLLMSSNAYVRIRAPVEAEGHEALLDMLMDHPYADELRVNKRGHWLHTFVREMSPQKLRQLAGIAARDGKKRNYLEIKFRRGQGKPPRATIGFRMHKGKIVGYEMDVPRCLEDIFDVQMDGNSYRNIKGIWVPDNYRPGDVVGSRR